MIRIRLTSIHVEDQTRAEDFYTDVLGFVVKHDIPLGDDRWLTVVSPDDRDGPELLLEPGDHPAARAYAAALAEDGIPVAQFEVDDVRSAFTRLSGRGVTFTQDPLLTGPLWTAVLDDTCGNLVQLVSPAAD